MPVVDHEVHESTRADTTLRRWCFNRPDPAPGYFAPDGLDHVGSHRAHVRLTWVPNRFSKECRYDEAYRDPACAGCKRQNEGKEYADYVAQKSKENAAA